MIDTIDKRIASMMNTIDEHKELLAKATKMIDDSDNYEQVETIYQMVIEQEIKLLEIASSQVVVLKHYNASAETIELFKDRVDYFKKVVS